MLTCTPIQKSTPVPSGDGIGVMKSRFEKRVPSLRKFESSVSDSCRASSATLMCLRHVYVGT